MSDWKNDINQILDLCEWVEEYIGGLDDLSSAFRMVRKPWKWENEYAAYTLWNQIPASMPELRQEVVVAAMEGREIDDRFIARMEERVVDQGSGQFSFLDRCVRLVLGETDTLKTGNQCQK